jgi:hypothetical protein
MEKRIELERRGKEPSQVSPQMFLDYLLTILTLILWRSLLVNSIIGFESEDLAAKAFKVFPWVSYFRTVMPICVKIPPNSIA